MRILERARRIERPTLTLARLCSTPELRPRSKLGEGYRPARLPFQAVLLFAFEHRLALGDERGLRSFVRLTRRCKADENSGGWPRCSRRFAASPAKRRRRLYGRC